ncbi:MAG: translation elongation factor Ts [Kiritimatiellae bacterium]|nr:translation elongation factor Ts [Kiritimatiellia bacterium]
MAEISAKQVKELREATNVGMMECKRALQEADGDMQQAIKLLRERGVAIAGKKASRAAKDGLISAAVYEDGNKAVMIQVNCETDFVARNENFQAFVKSLLEKAKGLADGALAEAVKDEMTAKITEIGENLVVSRNIAYALQSTGRLASYVHLGGKVGVLIEVACEKDETVGSEVFAELVKDLTLQIAAANPRYLCDADVPSEVVSSEKEIYVKQMEQEGKPANIIEKIVGGKIKKYFSQICLLDQEFVKDSEWTIGKLLAAKGKELGDTLSIRRFVRYQLGE